DQINQTVIPLGGEVEDMGNGNSEDYEIPQNIKPEDIAPESRILPEEKPAVKPGDKKSLPQDAKLPSENKTAIPANPNSVMPEKPKAVMPKKPAK
ncbi:MAG: hypothetical protein ACOVQE_02715, partial [Chitinophagaceae bacterium]